MASFTDQKTEMDYYSNKPLPPLPLAYASRRSSSIYSQSSEKIIQSELLKQVPPEQIYLQPTRFYSSTSKLPIAKPAALYEQPQQQSTLSLRLKPKLAEQHVVLHRAASYSKSKRYGRQQSGGGRRSRGQQQQQQKQQQQQLLSPPTVTIIAHNENEEGDDDDDDDANRPISRFSTDSHTEEQPRGRSRTRDSIFSYLSRLSTPKKDRDRDRDRPATSSLSKLVRRISTSSSSSSSSSGDGLQEEEEEAEVGVAAATTSGSKKKKNKKNKKKQQHYHWPRTSFMSSLLYSPSTTTTTTTRGKFILPNNNHARRSRSSGPARPPHLRWSSSSAAAQKALASIQRGASELKSGMVRVGRRVVEARAQRRKSQLKKKIRVIGEADQFPDGRVNWWI